MKARYMFGVFMLLSLIKNFCQKVLEIEPKADERD
jgi:hypothetical protein